MANFAQEYLSSSSLTRFPFSTETDVPPRIFRLFCDAVVNVPQGEEFSAVMRGISVADNGLRFSLVCGDRELNFFASAYDSGHYAVSRSGLSAFVIDLDHLRTSEPFSDSGEYPLSVACADFAPSGVESFSLMNSVRGGYPVVTDSNISGDVLFISGSNMTATVDESSIVLNAEPGAGEGVVPCDCDDTVAEDENEGAMLIPTPTGDIVLEGDGCLQVNTDNTSTVRINGRCTACCPTEKYVDLAERLAGGSQRLSGTRRRLLDLSSTYEEDVSDFNAFLHEPKKRELVLSLTAQAPVTSSGVTEWSNPAVTGFHSLVAVSTKLTNASQTEVTVELQRPDITLSRMDVIAAFASLPSYNGLGEGVSREIEYYSGSTLIVLPPGSTAHVMTLLGADSPEAYAPPGSGLVTQKARFSWIGKEKIEPAGDGAPRYDDVEKTYDTQAKAIFARALREEAN